MGGVGGSACRRRLLTRLCISRLARINIVMSVCSVRIKAAPELEAGEDLRCCVIAPADGCVCACVGGVSILQELSDHLSDNLRNSNFRL